MRTLALAAAIGVGLVATAAYAGPWSDPAGRVNFTAPNGWITEVRRDNPQTIVLSGNANNECYVLGTPNPNTANSSPIAVKRATNPLTPEAWQATANAISPMFPQHNAHLETQSVDTTGFWPVQRATFSGGEQPVMAALTSRPGVDLIAFCWTYGGPDATATYEALFASLGNNNDAQWRQRAEQQEAEQEAAQQAAAQAAAQAPQQQQPNQAAEPERTMNDPRSRRRHN